MSRQPSEIESLSHHCQSPVKNRLPIVQEEERGAERIEQADHAARPGRHMDVLLAAQPEHHGGHEHQDARDAEGRTAGPHHFMVSGLRIDGKNEPKLTLK